MTHYTFYDILITMTFQQYLNMRLNDNYWLDYIAKRYELIEQFPKVATYTIRTCAYHEWRKQQEKRKSNTN